MKRKTSIMPVFLLAFFASALSSSAEASGINTNTAAQHGMDTKASYFMSHPCISPDAKTIVFTYQGDLWQSSVDGGVASRLTALPGDETHAKISPDGKWVAFTSNQFGNSDVFVMPLSGGAIRQLTFNDANDEVDSWGWDSETIYFTSNRYNRFTSFKVSRDGGTAKRVFPHYFNTIHQVTEQPNGTLLFNDSWESYTAAHRKRYKGAFNPDILAYNPQNKTFDRLTSYEGKDFWHSVDQNGTIYYVSDAQNGEYNLYTFSKEKTAKPLTKFNTSIKRPSVSANGEKVVFEKDYQIYVYDVKSNKSAPLPVSTYSNYVLDKEQEFNVEGKITSFDVSPNGKLLAFVSRGAVFVSDIDGKFVRQIHDAGERVFEVNWMSDNKNILYSQTDNGYPNWFKAAADGKGVPQQLTTDLRSNRMLAFSPDRKFAVYLSGRDEVRLMDLATLKSRTIVKDEIWAFQNSAPSFSPDGAYVLFTAVRNFEQDVFVHHIASGKTTNLTNTGVTESNPVWSSDAKAIYFVSNRTQPSYPYGLRNAGIFRMELDNFDGPLRSEKWDQLFDTTGTNTSTTRSDKRHANSEASKQKSAVVQINMDGLRHRIRRVSPAFGSQANPFVIKKGAKEYLFFQSNHEGGRMALYRLVLEDFASPKTERVSDGYVSSILDADGKYFAIAGGNIQRYNIDQNKFDPIKIEHAFRRDLQSEFNQMFYETWAGIEENFYDSNFHGVNWPKVKQSYERFLPYISNRGDLRVLLNDMLGELNSSHLGFSSSGREEEKPYRFVTNETGIVFHPERPFEVLRLAMNSPATRIGRDIQTGDVLVAVDGMRVDPTMDRDYYFTRPTLAPELRLTFKRGSSEIETTVRTQSSAVLRGQFYDEWIQKNRSRVDSLGSNRIAYSHMKNMSDEELQSFLLDMVEQENQKDAIILDLRYNTGGNVHDEVLKFLSQRPYLNWQYRGGKKSPQGHFGPGGKPIVLLINQQSLSDAEMTAAGFKALGLGTIIGTETYRWIIFTSGKSLVDGSNYRIPAWGCYTLDGDNLELTGVAPDIYVQNTVEDLVNDRDPQLERAVREILNQL